MPCWRPNAKPAGRFVALIESKLDRKDIPFPLRPVNFQPPQQDGLEKIFGTSHLKSVAWLEQGVRASASVCRILTPNGLGTGFVTAGNRLFTNHHVIPTRAVAAQSHVEFNYQLNLQGMPEQSFSYRLDTEKFRASEPLDYATAEIEESDGNPPLSRGGTLDWSAGHAAAPGDQVAIIQHPQRGPKQIAVTANQVVNIFDHRLQYTTDTLPGSSGSPVFDDSWKVIALHHAGGNLLINTRGDRMFANEGILASFIRADL